MSDTVRQQAEREAAASRVMARVSRSTGTSTLSTRLAYPGRPGDGGLSVAESRTGAGSC